MLEKLKELDKLTGIAGIARRYFVMNAFDGLLTIIGVLIGTYISHVENAKVILATGLSTSVAMGISGMWGAYFSERSERRHELQDLEDQTLSDLSSSKIGKAAKQAVLIVTLVDGLSPFLAAAVALFPFMIASVFASFSIAFYLSFALIFVMLFGLGLFLGSISKEHLLISGVKMLAAGFLCIAIVFLIEQI